MSMSILIIGATGYIGGSILAKLLNHPSASIFDITVLVRSPEKAKVFEQKYPSIKAVVGSTNEEEKLSQLASEAHYVFSAASADDLAAVKAILRGMKNRHAKEGDVPILIHTSGTGVFVTWDKGLVLGQNIYDDSDSRAIASLPPDQPHRIVDVTIVEADQEGYLKSYLVLPSLIYGIANHKLVKDGLSNPHSIQLPSLIKVALARGQTGVVGKGVSVWPSVEIGEVADIYIRIFDGVISGNPAVGHGVDGYYSGLSDHFSWYEASQEIGRVLVKKGLHKSDEPTTFTEDELVKYFTSLFIGYFYGSTSRGVASHSKAIGWKPVKTTKDMLDSIEAEVDAILAQQKV